MRRGYVTFHSVSDSLAFERALKDSGLDVQLVPVPREISSSCGVAALFPEEREHEIRAFIEERGLEVDGIHLLEQGAKGKSLLERFK